MSSATPKHLRTFFPNLFLLRMILTGLTLNFASAYEPRKYNAVVWINLQPERAIKIYCTFYFQKYKTSYHSPLSVQGTNTKWRIVLRNTQGTFTTSRLAHTHAYASATKNIL